jgi:single-stranded-DNA-specific exonuclease
MGVPVIGKLWLWPQALPEEAAGRLGRFPPIQRLILWARGLGSEQEAEAFLRPAEHAPADPWQLRGMRPAVDRLLTARAAGETVVVYGDYDTDGVTATALLTRALAACGIDARHYIPDRFEEGYGVNADALRKIAASGARVVVTVDCGIRAIEETAIASGLGLDLIITDHHQPGDELPPARALINPKQPGDESTSKDLAGVGLAYKLAQALYSSLDRPGAEQLLDLVALGTVADVAPLQGENRSLVAGGLARLNRDPRAGMRRLLEVARCKLGRVRASTIAYVLAPRLNAAGRLESAEAAYRLLTTEQPAEAARLAAQLDELNQARQQITREMVERARMMLESEGPPGDLVFVAAEDFNEGVVGLAANRLMEEFYRPALVARWEPEITRGSARSIPEFHITRALDQCADLLLRHGGHSSAAGFTLPTGHLDAFRQRLARIAREALGERPPQPHLRIDAEVGFEQLDGELLEFLERLEPTGFGNPAPVLGARRVRVLRARAVGREGGHLKLTLSHGRRMMDAIAFQQGSRAADIPPVADVAFRLERDDYLGFETLQLSVLDFRATEG